MAQTFRNANKRRIDALPEFSGFNYDAWINSKRRVRQVKRKLKNKFDFNKWFNEIKDMPVGLVFDANYKCPAFPMNKWRTWQRKAS